MNLEWKPEVTQHYMLGSVHESISVKGQLIRFLITLEPTIDVIANVAGGAQVYKYHKNFDSVEDAKAFAQSEFDLFVMGESLSV